FGYHGFGPPPPYYSEWM
nr:BEgp=nonamelogenin glycoprotein {N-terminal} [cattle, enamel organ cells, ameloblasts and epithelial cells, Peptide Partial, 17 aa] [Bos taurus]